MMVRHRAPPDGTSNPLKLQAGAHAAPKIRCAACQSFFNTRSEPEIWCDFPREAGENIPGILEAGDEGQRFFIIDGAKERRDKVIAEPGVVGPLVPQAHSRRFPDVAIASIGEQDELAREKLHQAKPPSPIPLACPEPLIAVSCWSFHPTADQNAGHHSPFTLGVQKITADQEHVT